MPGTHEVTEPHTIRERFSEEFGAHTGPIATVFAPGRVNLLGDHIDYCGGTVLPMPIQFGTWVVATESGADEIRARSLNRDGQVTFRPNDSCEQTVPWGKFVKGAAQLVAEYRGMPVKGMDILVSGNIPAGGLSSSASLSLALITAMARLHGKEPAPLAKALLAQRLEHEFIGVNCGLMDQAAIVFGEPDCTLRFDCRSNHYQHIAVDPLQCAILVVDSGVPRTLAASAYNRRREELTEFATRLNLDPDRLAVELTADRVGAAEDVVTRRARHVFTEQQRVIDALTALDARDWTRFGTLLKASHASLRDDYEVSCPELDMLAGLLSGMPGCFGARMTGAGFGGAVVAAVEPGSVDACRQHLKEVAIGKAGIEPFAFVARSSGGIRCYD